MNKTQRIRFIVTSFSSRQGLKASLIGLYLLAISLWSNFQPEPNSDLSLPIVITIIVIVLALLLKRYYEHTFGIVEPTSKHRRLETLISLALVLLSLGAFILDTTERLPFSLVGIVLALAILGDALRMLWVAKFSMDSVISFYFLAAVLAFIASFLPLFAGGWLETLGFHATRTAVMAAIGLILILLGLLSHFRFVRLFPATGALSHD